ncbi:M28 family peptidase [Aliikangiella maris]|uniref:M28 family peptidase n=2 Tax=Aliikangiella maris TaxID=3162458 RepID=A0ABV3MLI8_9GAMM
MACQVASLSNKLPKEFIAYIFYPALSHKTKAFKFAAICLLSLFILGCIQTSPHCLSPPKPTGLINAKQLFKDLQTLAHPDMQGRKTNTLGSQKAQQFIQQKFEQIGLQALQNNFRQPFYFGKNNEKGVNLFGKLAGRHKTKKNHLIVISAHYDHLGQQGTKIYHGSDDNASGVAALLTIAQFFKTYSTDYSLIFLATDAEEAGLYGAQAFLNASPIKPKQILFNINLDMISRGGRKNRLYVAGTRFKPVLKSITMLAAQPTQLCLKPGHQGRQFSRNSLTAPINWDEASDHYIFNKHGIDYLYFGVDLHPDYHQSSDTPEKTNLAFYTATVETIISTIQRLDKLVLGFNQKD